MEWTIPATNVAATCSESGVKQVVISNKTVEKN